MIETVLQSEAVVSVLVQMPFVAVMGVIMLGMRQDLRDLRQDMKDCTSRQGGLLEALVKKEIERGD